MNTSHLARIATDAITAGRLADAFSDWLGAAVAACALEDGRWSVEMHFDRAPDQNEIRNLVCGVAGEAASNALTFEAIAPRDWVAASLAELKPVAAGRFLVHGAHDRGAVPSHRVGVEIEAALAFGTGHHGTTRGCLLAFDRLLKTMAGAKNNKTYRILDVGTGSGVLAIAAAQALHCRALASDVDAGAVRVARDNARINHVAANVEFICAPGVSLRRMQERAPYDLVFANILLSPLRLLATPMARLLGPHARVILSGLLSSQANSALAAYRGLRLEHRIVLDGWTTLALRRA